MKAVTNIFSYRIIPPTRGLACRAVAGRVVIPSKGHRRARLHSRCYHTPTMGYIQISTANVAIIIPLTGDGYTKRTCLWVLSYRNIRVKPFVVRERVYSYHTHAWVKGFRIIILPTNYHTPTTGVNRYIVSALEAAGDVVVPPRIGVNRYDLADSIDSDYVVVPPRIGVNRYAMSDRTGDLLVVVPPRIGVNRYCLISR
jgi:hypothetical protein